MYDDIRNEQPMPFWCINPVADNYSKKYIWGGVNLNSIKLFFKLCNMRIYINGFVDNELAGMTIYHKRIYKPDNIITEDSILFFSDMEKRIDIPIGIEVCYNPIVLNPRVSLFKSYIYGAGEMGKRLLNYLNKNNIEVKGFIDSDVKKVNTEVLGVKVYEKNILKYLDQEATVIEAGKFYVEMDTIVRGLNDKVNRCFCTELPLRDEVIWIDDREPFHGAFFLDNINENKKIYLCGNNVNILETYYDVFKLLDFENICIANWAESINDSDADNLCCIEDALLEENCLIVYCCKTIDMEELKKLNNLGLERGKDFCDIKCDIWEGIYGKQMLDLNLAHTRSVSGKVPGIAVFGNNYVEDYKIAILGGSTSTSGYYRFKSWPEFLYEKFCRDSVTIFNGAIESYTSAQELIKLMRDIIWLKPDLVIVYDGNNDVVRDDSFNIFEIPFMKTLIEHAIERHKTINKTTEEDVFCGMSPLADCIEVWLKNIEYMHAVCEINDIKFVSFMQPNLLSKTRLSNREQVLTKKIEMSLLRGGEEINIKKQVEQFREQASDICHSHKYIFDLSHVFDTEDVYMDHCHIFEAGNRIIADEIYKVVCEVIGEPFVK